MRLLAFARTFVPSTDSVPKRANPILRATRTTSTNSPLKSSRCRRRNSQSVRWLGKFPAPNTRNATSSSGFPAIPRDGKTPVAYPYGGTFTIIRGPYGALRRPSPSYGAWNAVRSNSSTRSLT